MLFNKIIHEFHILLFPTKSGMECQISTWCVFIQKGDPVLDFYILTDIWNHSLGRVGKSLDGFGNKGQIPRSLLWRKLYRN